MVRRRSRSLTGPSVQLALFLGVALFVQPAHPGGAKGRGVVLESVVPDVGTAHSFTAVALYGTGFNKHLPTLGCRFGDQINAVQTSSLASDSVKCLTPSLGPGFVVVGFAQTTGKTYAPGRDDISYEQGHNVFEFVQPWLLKSISPQEVYATGGQLLFIQGQHMRPELRCDFLGGPPSGVSYQFVSSGLSVCEAQAGLPRTNGMLIIQHDSHATPDGQRVSFGRRAMSEVSYAGYLTVSVGDEVVFSSTVMDETEPFSSIQENLGCQFEGVWVAASVQNSPGKFRCIVPASKVGRVQITASELHSRWPLPLSNSSISAIDVPNSGRFALEIKPTAIVEIIAPTAGTTVMQNSANHIDVYGQHLVFEVSSFTSVCAKVTGSPSAHRNGGPEVVRLRCLASLSVDGNVESARFRVGFNAVMVPAGPGHRRSVEVQYLLQAAPQILATTSATVIIGDVLTLVGDNFIDVAGHLWCVTDSSRQVVNVVSSVISRCVVPWEHHKTSSTLRRSSSAGSLKIGIVFGETEQSSSNVMTTTRFVQSPRVGMTVPNLGFSYGGTQVLFFPEKGGVGATRFWPTTTCRFGTILQLVSSIMNDNAVLCTSPALAPGMVSLGAPVPGLFGDAVKFKILDGPSTLVSASTTITSSRNGIVGFALSSSALESHISFRCLLPPSNEALVPVYSATSGHYSCPLPTLQPGFRMLEIAVTHFSTPNSGGRPSSYLPSARIPNIDHLISMTSEGMSRVYHDAELQVSPPAPSVFVQRHHSLGETYPGDILHIVATTGELYGDMWCTVTTGSWTAEGSDTSKVQAIVASSVLALCEVPTLYINRNILLSDATVNMCLSHSCLGSSSLPSSHDGGHLSVGSGDKMVVGISPHQGPSLGGTLMRISYDGPLHSLSPQHSTCRVGSIGPITGSIAFIGYTVDMDCVSPAHQPGVVSVAIGKGTGWVDGIDLTFTFMEATDDDVDALQDAKMLENDLDAPTRNFSSSPSNCDDVLSIGDILVVWPAFGTSEGGTEIMLVLDGIMSQIAIDGCGIQGVPCRVGTIWVLGRFSQEHFVCITPAHAPGSVDVTAPKLVSGPGQSFMYQSAALLAPEPDDESMLLTNANREAVHFKSRPRMSIPGGLIDVAAAEMMNRKSRCIFISQSRVSAPWMFVTSTHVVSSVIIRCEAPPRIATLDVYVVEQEKLESSVSMPTSFSPYRTIPSCTELELSPGTSSEQGGIITRVRSSCQISELLTSMDGRIGCRFGTLGPIAASTGHEGLQGVECVAPAHAPGVVPFALTINWRDAIFEPSMSGFGQPVQFVFRSDRMGYTMDQNSVPLMQQRHYSLPLMSNVVPWLVWGGNVLHITGRELPNNENAVCVVGSSFVAAFPISSALVLCDPFPVMSNFISFISNSQLAGGMKEISLSVASVDSLSTDRLGGESASLTMFVIPAAPVVDVDVIDGWEQGGGHVNVELGGWAPTGLMDCHFGTVAVHGREGGGAGWQSRAAMGRGIGEWWSEATIATDVECVTPARRAGEVPIGVSLAHSTSASFGDRVSYKYL